LRSSFDKANDLIKKSAKTLNKGIILIEKLVRLELRPEGLHESALVAIERAKD